MKAAARKALEAAGYIQPRVKKPKPVPSEKFAPGTLIAKVVVEGRPVPWKAPTTTRTGHSFKDKRMVAWQEQVREAARAAMGDRVPYSHPVLLKCLFAFEPHNRSQTPDLSNLVKCCEDALQKIVITNDRNVAKNEGERIDNAQFGRATIWVYAYGE